MLSYVKHNLSSDHCNLIRCFLIKTAKEKKEKEVKEVVRRILLKNPKAQKKDMEEMTLEHLEMLGRYFKKNIVLFTICDTLKEGIKFWFKIKIDETFGNVCIGCYKRDGVHSVCKINRVTRTEITLCSAVVRKKIWLILTCTDVSKKTLSR